jgi:hypothetical protein
MGQIRRHPPVKLIIGFIFKQECYFKQARRLLCARFGRVDFESRVLDFDYTSYYEKEFGRGLKRKFLSFERLISPQSLVRIKQVTNRIENKLRQRQQQRVVNIDPGYIELSKLVLATTKDYSHRLYLSKGIFAEVTLLYRDNSFRSLPWTYPDYNSSTYIEILNQIRQLYIRQKQDSKKKCKPILRI